MRALNLSVISFSLGTFLFLYLANKEKEKYKYKTSIKQKGINNKYYVKVKILTYQNKKPAAYVVGVICFDDFFYTTIEESNL